ncbi:MAG: hypothetical protein KDC44_12015, partial [Phaeodactylibacter sp.]|nr:hypothetical protein [Phaeodactylibacter sp.]
QPVLQTLDLHWEDQLLQTPSTSPLKMDGWLQDERGAVQTGSIGRFQRLPAAAQAKLIQAAAAVRIAPRFAAQHQLDLHSIADICDRTGYAYQPATIHAQNWRTALVKDRLRRLLRFYPTGWTYPVVVR